MLLTRPPLSSSESIQKLHQKNSVRLACVRRAASVRPEPGSNSLLNGIFKLSLQYQSLIALLNANLLSISTLFCVHPEFLVILIKNLKVMFLILYCSIFKELRAALATAYLLYHIHSSLSSTFLKFFKFLFSEF